MKKCKEYPNCDCYNWEKAAKVIDPTNAELFVLLMQEMDTYLQHLEWVEYQPLNDLINSKMELLPESMQLLYSNMIYKHLEFHYAWKFTERSNLVKLKNSLTSEINSKLEAQNSKNFPAKFYALFHCMQIDMGAEKYFSKNDYGEYNKQEIIAYAKNKYPECKSSQGFYQSFIILDVSNPTAISNSFPKGYKNILIKISNNDHKLITYLKKFPD